MGSIALSTHSGAKLFEISNSGESTLRYDGFVPEDVCLAAARAAPG